MSKDDDILSDAKEAFARCEEAESENREEALDDLKFAKLGEQWPEKIREQRVRDGRPCLVLNRMPAFIRQVVNDIRQNRPSIKVHPVGDGADQRIAEIYSGLIRNIEQTSKADVAYDTAADFAVSSGRGFFRIDTDYCDDDSFDLNLVIKRVANPFSIYGDPMSAEADSSDWNEAFVTELLPKSAFEAKYKGAEEVDWEEGGYSKLKGTPWVEGQAVLIAEWWQREKVPATILKLSDGSVVEESVFIKQQEAYAAKGIEVIGTRKAQRHKVTQRVLTGAEVLETNDWAGKYIPIVPVYGDEVNVEGKRHFRSLIRDAKDPQRMFNYMRTTSAELTALAPRVPFIGRKNTFKSDAAKWKTINSQNHAYIEYDGEVPPQRQPMDSGRAVGAIQESASSSDDMKSILGIYDASLGAQGNETSGKAIIARQREGDVSTFHFSDNLARAIEHGGRILIDLIPKVYTNERMIRVLSPDNSAETVQLGQPIEVRGPDGKPQVDETGQSITVICDLSAGKYDLTVETGPSYGTKRQEAAEQMSNLIQAYPDAAPILGDLVAKNLDWPDADEVAKRLKALLPPQLQEGGAQSQDPMADPRVQQMMQQGMQMIEQTQAQLQQVTQEFEALKQDKAIETRKLGIEEYKAKTDRIKVVGELAQPEQQEPFPDAA